MVRTALFVSMLSLMLTTWGCSTGCWHCEGISAPREICEGDFQESSDFNAYLGEYVDQGGVCTED